MTLLNKGKTIYPLRLVTDAVNLNIKTTFGDHTENMNTRHCYVEVVAERSFTIFSLTELQTKLLNLINFIVIGLNLNQDWPNMLKN